MVTIKPSFSTRQINEALKNGGDFEFGLGTYTLDECLVLHSNTKVNAEKAVFVRNHKGRMLQTYVSPATVKYNGVHDVEWIGGQFYAGSVTENANVITLFHGKSISFRGVIIDGCRGMHSVEINACKDVLLENFLIKNQSSKKGEAFREAIQLDFANYDGLKVKGAKPDSPCYDGTHCSNIILRTCTIKSCPNGIGTHTVSKGNGYHKNISIESCVFSVHHWGIKLYGFDGCYIYHTQGDFLVGTKDVAHLNTGGKVDLSTPKRNKNIVFKHRKDYTTYKTTIE